jgi:MarR family transcriptional regulator, organic hydroperoxide resistance regulator
VRGRRASASTARALEPPPAEAASGRAMQHAHLGESLDFLRWIWAVNHGLETTSKRMEATLGITGPQRLAIRLIGRFPAILPGRLAELMHLHPSTISGLLTRLERRGLVERHADPRDRRRVMIGLTARGRSLDTPAHGTIEAAVAQVLAKFPTASVDAAREVLRALSLVLGERPGQPGRGG